MKSIKPGIPPPPVKGPSLNKNDIPREKYFKFTFKHWLETENFGVGNVDCGWHVALLNRLHDLSKEKIARFFDDLEFQDSIRYHEIDWDARNIPMSRSDFKWLPKSILSNPDDFPFFQFHISKGAGRVHGFWDEEYCFNILLLDPLHNLQPSKDVCYVVRPTSMSSCHYSELTLAVDRLADKHCSTHDCELAIAARTLRMEPTSEQCVIMAGVTLDVAKEYVQLRQTRNVSLSEILSHGITFFPVNRSSPGSKSL